MALQSPPKRHNSRGSPRNCNKYRSADVADEANVPESEDPVIGKATSGRGSTSKSASSSHSGGKHSHGSVITGRVQKKGDRSNHVQSAPADSDGRYGKTGGAGELGSSGRGGSGGQEGAPDDNGFVTIRKKGKGRADEDGNSRGPGEPDPNDAKNWYRVSTNIRDDFPRGTIWNIAYHMLVDMLEIIFLPGDKKKLELRGPSKPNLDPRLNNLTNVRNHPNGKYVKMTYARAVFSKYRWVIVLWRFQDKMIVVPIYSFEGQGIAAKSKEMQKELMEIVNSTENHPASRTNAQNVILKAQMISPLTKPSCVRLAAAFSVDYAVHMTKVGELVKASKKDLLNAMDGMIARSKSETT